MDVPWEVDDQVDTVRAALHAVDAAALVVR